MYNKAIYNLAATDLATFSNENLLKLKTYFNIPDRITGKQLLWILAINIFNESYHKSYMATIKPKDFTQVIGAGGYGTIIKNNDANIVGKFLNIDESCGASKIEFKKHLRIYKAFKTALRKTNRYKQICISKPIAFNSGPVTVLDRQYSCYYLMSLIDPLDQHGLYHIISQEEYAPTMNKVIGKRSSEPVSIENPSRGFFATKSYIINKLLHKYRSGEIKNFDDLLLYMGFSFGVILFGADLMPIDVEYLLGKTERGLCFSVLDFGMTTEINLNTDPKIIAEQIVDNILDIEIYYPTDSDDIAMMKTGIIDAFNIFATSSKKALLDALFENWY